MKYLRMIPKDWLASSGTAVLLHSFIFFGGGFVVVQPAQYGVEATAGGIEVSLIAALPATAEKKSFSSESKEESNEKDGEIVDKVEESEPDSSKNNPNGKDYSFVNKSPYSGDGSSPVPGESPVTFYSPGGGSVKDKPGHLKNSPPHYPRAAISKGQEGLVILKVLVDKSGRAEKVELKQSSNYVLLDESALKAVRKWKFDPAHMGFITTSSEIEIPIRFVLEEELKRLEATGN